MTYLDNLGDELAAAGIRGGRRARILAEFADHLACDPDAGLGTPRDLARQFADELGTSLARRAALLGFAALAVAGAAFVAAFLAHRGVLRSASDTGQPFSDIAAALMVIGPQVALAAGLLGALRALRRRGTAVVPRAEATVIVRRAATGLVAGLASMVGFAWMALILGDRVPGWWVVLTVSLSGAGALALLAAAPAVLAAARVRPVAGGAGGDLFDDFGGLMPPRLRGRPWSVALVLAAGIVVVVALAGVVQSDPFDGILRGIADGVACLVGFGVLGRYLGLRS